MGVLLKEKKTRMTKVSLLDLSQIKGMINFFRIDTRGDMQRLNEIEGVCEIAEKTRIGIIEKFKTDNNISNDIVIDEHHTHYGQLYTKLLNEEIEINKDALARFTQKEFDFAVTTGDFKYGSIKLLEKYLIKKD